MPAPAVSRAPQVTKLLSALPRAKDTAGFGKIQAGLDQVADQVRTRRARPPRPAKAAGPRGARAPADARSSPSQMTESEEGHAATLMAQLLGGLDKALGFSTSPKGRQLDADDDALYSVLAALTAGAQRLSKSKKSAKLLVSDVAPAAAAQFHHLLSVALSSDYHIEAREVALEFVSVPPPTAAASRRLPPPRAAPRRARPPRAPPAPQEVCKCSATTKDGGDGEGGGEEGGRRQEARLRRPRGAHPAEAAEGRDAPQGARRREGRGDRPRGEGGGEGAEGGGEEAGVRADAAGDAEDGRRRRLRRLRRRGLEGDGGEEGARGCEPPRRSGIGGTGQGWDGRSAPREGRRGTRDRRRHVCVGTIL